VARACQAIPYAKLLKFTSRKRSRRPQLNPSRSSIGTCTAISDVVYCHSMAEEKSRSKDIILWIITVALIALAIFWYKR